MGESLSTKGAVVWVLTMITVRLRGVGLLAGSVVLYCAGSRLELMLTTGHFVLTVVLALIGFTDLLVEQELTQLFVVSVFLFSIELVVFAAQSLRPVVAWVRRIVLWRQVH